MSLIGWLALGMIAGWLGNKMAAGRRASPAVDSALGVGGAVGGGFMFWNFGGGSIGSFNIYSMVVAGLGALVALLSYHALFVYPGDDRD